MDVFSNALQDAVFVGSTASSQPLGIHNSTNIPAIDFGSSAGTTPSSSGSNWGRMLVGRQQLLDANVDPTVSRISAVWSPRTERQFWFLKASDHQPLQRPGLHEGVRFLATPAPRAR